MIARYFGLTGVGLVGACIGLALGIFLTCAMIEGPGVYRGIILPLGVGIPLTLFFMWLGSVVE